MKITKTQLKQIIKEELEEAAYKPGRAVAGIEASMSGVGRFDKMFEKGGTGHVFAEKVASQLMLDEESDFEALVRSIKDALQNWRNYR